ncbi:response regulator transcription factor [Micromonospora parva]|uniref:response regulator transcription factor n=1 Tax=Micromonospora parva TaxID=1464048 RepID=UPI00068B398D|nr:response regulator transcription factor [Micromonospora parva]
MLHVAVLDPLPLFREGAATVLSRAGHRVEAPEDVLAWAASRRLVVVLLTLLDEPNWELLVRLRDEPAAAVVAVLQDLHPAAVRAVHLGARSVLARASGPASLCRTVEATADGQAVLPADVLAALTSGPQGQPGMLSEVQLSWLRRLAAGSTVAELADAAGYSERAMFRILKQLYRDMDVSNRMEAVLRAQELGWLPSSIRGS